MLILVIIKVSFKEFKEFIGTNISEIPVVVSETVAAPTSTSTQAVEKRNRGRPRKNPLQPTTTTPAI